MPIIKGETDRYAKKIGQVVHGDETLVLAVRVMHDTKDRGVLGAFVTVANAAVGPDVQIIPRGSLAERAPRKGRSLWVLTTERMLFFKTPAVALGEPRASFVLAEVSSVTATKAKVHYGKLAIDFRDGSRIVFDMLSDREAVRINERAAALLGPN